MKVMKTARTSNKSSKGICYFRFPFLMVAAVFVLSACTSFGPRRVGPDRFNYSEALANSARDQMLLNLVRIRYLEEPVFLAISSILTQYVYNVGASAGANILLEDVTDNTSSVSAGANLGYEERPTITYIPIEGRDFTDRMQTSMPSDTIFAAAQQGWSVDMLIRLGINRIGPVENMSFEAIPPIGVIDLSTQLKREVEKLRQFQRVVELLTILADLEAFEVRLVEEDGVEKQYLVFAEAVPEAIHSIVRELRQILGLSSRRNRFLITERTTDLQESEISIQTRSLAAMMTFMAKGVEVPPEHLAEGRVFDLGIPTGEDDGKHLFPFRMRSSKDPPKSSFAAVRYQGYWFYINHRDIDSKRALSLILALFRFLAPSEGGAAPILSLPTG